MTMKIENIKELMRRIKNRNGYHFNIKQHIAFANHGYVVIHGLNEKKSQIKIAFDADEEFFAFVGAWIEKKKQNEIDALLEAGVEDANVFGDHDNEA